MKNDDHLNSAFAALSDPTRRDILRRLRSGPLTAGALAENYSMSRPAVSQHLGVLEKAGLIQRNRHAQWSECSLVADALEAPALWLLQQQAMWNEHFDHLEDYLDEGAKP